MKTGQADSKSHEWSIRQADAQPRFAELEQRTSQGSRRVLPPGPQPPEFFVAEAPPANSQEAQPRRRANFTANRVGAVPAAYQATMHLNGQSTVVLDGDRATGESYCIAHHLFTDDGERKLMVPWLRYGDTFVKVDGTWLFAERKLYVDWTETRSSLP